MNPRIFINLLLLSELVTFPTGHGVGYVDSSRIVDTLCSVPLYAVLAAVIVCCTF